MFQYTMWMLVHPAYLVLSSATPSNEIFCGSFLIKNLVIVVCLPHQQNDFFLQPQEQKICRRLTQCSSTLCGCLCTQPIRCCPLKHFQMRYFAVHFDQKSSYLCAYLISKTNFFLQPHEQKMCRRLTQCSSILC